MRLGVTQPPHSRSFAEPKRKAHIALAVSKTSSAGTPHLAAANDAAVPSQQTSNCPVIRALQEAPEYQSRGLLDSFEMIFGRSVDFQAKQIQGRPFVKGWTMGKTFIAGDAALAKAMCVDDTLFPLSRHKKALMGPEGILFLTGEKHSWLRALMAPAFAPEEIEKYTPRVQELVTKYMDTLAEQCEGGKSVPAYQQLRLLTFEIICRVVLGLQLSKQELQDMLQDYQTFTGGFLLNALPEDTPFLDLPFLPRAKALAALTRLTAQVEGIIDQVEEDLRKGKHQAGRGLLQEMVALGENFELGEQHAQQAGEHAQQAGQQHSRPEPRGAQQQPRRLSRAQLIDNMILFLLAGFDTTSSLLTAMMYNASKYPQHWRLVVEEQQAIVAQHGPNLTPRLLRQMSATEHFVKETLRLQHPAPQTMRVATRDTELGGYSVPKGSRVYIPLQYYSVYDPLWADQEGDLAPTVFNPSRFVGVKGSGQQMAFGYGKHVCLGLPLAMMEAKVAVAVWARGYEVKALKEPTWINVPVSQCQNGLPVVVTRKS